MSESSAYDNQIFKALGKFKHIRIWPDLNGCLQGLLDIFAAFPENEHVSHKLIFAKTLSQCLAPVLPAGIQSKALEVYSQVFARIGVEKLSRDFSVWAPGLFQFFHCAGVALRAQALKLFIDYFVPAFKLNKKIGPPLLLAVLPGIVDEGSDVKASTAALIDTIRCELNEVDFWHAMFKSCLTSPATRSAFFSIALQNDPEIVMKGEYSDLTLAMFLSVFKDPNVLVVRSCLELFISCFPFTTEDVQRKSSKGCIELLKIDDQSIRRRVFNWIIAFQSHAAEAVCSASTEVIKVMLQKGGIPKDLVISVLPKLVSRPDFDISAAVEFIDVEILVKATIDQYDYMLQLLQIIDISSELQRDIISHILSVLKTTSDTTTAQKLCRIADFVVNSVTEDMSDICREVLTHIFTSFKADEIILSFATKLVGVIDIDAPFELLINEQPIHFVAVHELLRMASCNLSALLVADKNADVCITNCWTELKKSERTISVIEICAALVQMYHKYPAQFSVSLSKNWDDDSVINFIQNSSELPICFLIICYQKALASDSTMTVNTGNGSMSSDVLRTIATRAEYLVKDAKKNITDDDPQWARVVISSILNLVESFSSIFHASIGDQSMINFIQFLVYKRGTSQLLFALLSTTKSAAVLNSVTPVISDFIVSHPKDVWMHRLLIPIATYDLPMQKLLNLVNDSPMILSTLVSVLSLQQPSHLHYKNLKFLCVKLVQLIQTYHFNDSIFYDITSLFTMITKLATEEVVAARRKINTSGIKKLLSSSETLSDNDCVASLTIGYLKEEGISTSYCSLAPRFLPEILTFIISRSINETTPNGFTGIFARFDTVWNLLLFYSLAITEGNQDPRLVSSLLSTISEKEILPYLSNMIYVFSFGETANKVKLISFIECALKTSHTSFATQEAVNIFAAMFSTLKIDPILTVHFIVQYMNTLQGNVQYQALQAPFMNALNELKEQNNFVEALKMIVTVQPKSLLNMFSSKEFPSTLMKLVHSSCDKTNPIYPCFISRFMTEPGEGFTWYQLIFAILSDASLFSRGKEYLTNLGSVLKIAAKDKDSFTALLFEYMSAENFPHIWKMPKDQAALRIIVVLSFIIFSCPPDTFSSRQQNINAQLMQALSKEVTSEQILKVFSLFMRVLFVRANSKLIEAFTSILVHELSSAFNSDNAESRHQAEILLDASMKKIPSSFQFEEFVFFPDLLSFPGSQNEAENQDSLWPILKDSKASLGHLTVDESENDCYEDNLFDEFCNSESFFVGDSKPNTN